MSNKIGQSIHGVVLQPRAIIRPKASVSVATESQKTAVLKSAKAIMNTHHKTLKALRDR